MLFQQKMIMGGEDAPAVSPLVAVGTATTGAGLTFGQTVDVAVPAHSAGDIILVACMMYLGPYDVRLNPSGPSEIFFAGAVNMSETALITVALYSFEDTGGSTSSFTFTSSGTTGSLDPYILQAAVFRPLWDFNSGEPTFIGGSEFGYSTSEQNIGPIPAVAPTTTGLAIAVGAKADDWTSVAPMVTNAGLVTWTEIDEPDTTSGNDAGLVWNYVLVSGSTGDAQFTVTGGSTAIICGAMIAFDTL